jgi:hypothetical protein
VLAQRVLEHVGSRTSPTLLTFGNTISARITKVQMCISSRSCHIAQQGMTPNMIDNRPRAVLALAKGPRAKAGPTRPKGSLGLGLPWAKGGGRACLSRAGKPRQAPDSPKRASRGLQKGCFGPRKGPQKGPPLRGPEIEPNPGALFGVFSGSKKGSKRGQDLARFRDPRFGAPKPTPKRAQRASGEPFGRPLGPLIWASGTPYLGLWDPYWGYIGAKAKGVPRPWAGPARLSPGRPPGTQIWLSAA